MKKFLKITGIVLGVILLIAIILPFALVGKIDTIVKKEANKMLNAQFDYTSSSISLFRHFPNASVDLDGLQIVNNAPFEGDTLVSADRISVVMNIMSLFKSSGIEVHKLVVDRPHANARISADGSAH